MDRVEEAFDNYMAAATWYHETYGQRPAAPRNGLRPRLHRAADFRIAYF